MTTWQTLAEQANDKWYNGSLKNKRYTKFIKALPKIEKEAVLLKDLLCLLTSGGFWQWIVNGYCVSIAEVIEVLKQIRKPASIKLLLMLVQIEPYLQKNREKGDGFEKLVVAAIVDENNPFWDRLDRFSYQFHEFREVWEQEVEAYLATQI
ncbi:DMP19 family protein [Chlorogloea sp. CCALA 695]|uniref:DMP19 family protein n=1 Tax=Chlorogloea sp. CCALA 695 TaxID=2107693 RepID=UPI000D07809C|nr:hypothetical protein [Chlorogloea sp. CCALA 695]PSB28365.1 hypothetical protein C7B70_21150 [Chlorogloea sp. CCALA 695]